MSTARWLSPMHPPDTAVQKHTAQAHRLSVAPMMDWSDRHCRYFHRLMTRRAMLSAEMLTAEAVIHGPKSRLLDYSPDEHPVALQLGGSDPRELARAVRLARDWGYDEINLNVGCPSDRVTVVMVAVGNRERSAGYRAAAKRIGNG